METMKPFSVAGIPPDELNSFLSGTHGDAFRILGPHRIDKKSGENSTCLPAPARPENPAMHSTRAPNVVSQPNIALQGNENRPGSRAVR